MTSPIEAAQIARMNALASILDKHFKPFGYGFTLLVYPLDGRPGAMNYISSAARETMIVAMKELIARFEGRVVTTETKQ